MQANNPWAGLGQPFSFEQVAIKIQAANRERTRGLIVPYVDARAIMDRRDEAVGPDAWSDHYQPLPAVGDRVFIKCELTIAGVAKEDAGEGEDYKSAYSDALKRAAVKFGIGRYLYNAEKVWADIDERGQILNEAVVKRQVLGMAAPESIRPTGNSPKRQRNGRPITPDEAAYYGTPMPSGT